MKKKNIVVFPSIMKNNEKIYKFLVLCFTRTLVYFCFD